ncbi:MAG: hypothetical protein M3525_16290 [Acidobacteriota bacterium]|nr:hypothetical protein [Acidobacteriota bacterium]
MEVLSEFPLEYDNDEEITKSESTSRIKTYIGIIENNVIISSLSRNTGEITGDLVVEKRNIVFIADSINELLNREKPWEESIKAESGKDKLLIYYSSSWANNLPAPFERVNIENKRNYELDNLRSRDWWLILPPRMAQKLADEIAKLFG